ncbi:thiamin phosphate synthase (thiamin phosphate pyrophosphorylase) [Wigglesworthia glossinidia endosymbiont of Glossina morsitans morsitans (Yale colony)]|uniref:Thiamine-phosphate synthase n=1 Tax=Wigglesworthia glossinidia endosymbiont of Glossina morsitans morsitans (Yale colony) TaxID=1142511 RepID=H6Q4N1_WIGGL|nr:thiamine phosphate synthase [Wigglesworthia glossinidia]AFA41091.1 thiamin phosphate synthase (thiamin phosphate pyrophosphorylase) [Wigglesworthia glossinidia endosymbiont of Glossina morsitans morsitans (Yale colony)]
MKINQIFFPKFSKKIGLYPIVDSIEWLIKILSTGIKIIQLRIKNMSEIKLDENIKKSVMLGKKYKAYIIINDYWELAIKHQAHGIHLGQEDMQNANRKKIYDSGLYLGLSTHNDIEIKHALSWNPSYIAFGHIFHTTTKIMHSQPQGIQKLKELCKKKYNCQKVAIGGIGLKEIDEVLSCNVDGVSMISAIKNSKNWKNTISRIQKKIRSVL